MFAYVFYDCVGIGFMDWLEKGFTYEKSFEICIWQDVKIQVLWLNLL